MSDILLTLGVAGAADVLANITDEYVVNKLAFFNIRGKRLVALNKLCGSDVKKIKEVIMALDSGKIDRIMVKALLDGKTEFDLFEYIHRGS
jgi:hypothetical protein